MIEILRKDYNNDEIKHCFLCNKKAQSLTKWHCP